MLDPFIELAREIRDALAPYVPQGCGCLPVAIAVVVGMVGTYLIAPAVVHPFAYALYAHWPFWLMVVALVVGVFLLLDDDRDGGGLFFLVGVGLSIIGVFGVLTFMVMGGAWKHIAYLERTSVVEMESEPDTTGLRYLPYEVAAKNGQSKSTESWVSLDDFEPAMDESGEAYWISARRPNGLVNSIRNPQHGALTVRAASDVNVIDTEIPSGIGSCCLDANTWQAVNTRFWADYSPRPYPYVLNDELVVIRPYLWHRPSFPVMVPEYAGVLIFREDGSVEDLTPDEAAEKYPTGRFFPEEMVEYFNASYQYKDGILNAWFFFRDMPDVPEIEGMTNQMPYFIPTDDGPAWYSAVEPYGSSNQSVYAAYYQDATTGDVSIYEFPEARIGPERALTFPPAEYQELKNLVILEPRPVIRSGELFWLMSATTDQYPDVQFSAVLNASTREVFRLDDQEAVRAFVESGTVPSQPGGGSGEATASDSEATGAPTDEELIQLLRDAADALDKGGSNG